MCIGTHRCDLVCRNIFDDEFVIRWQLGICRRIRTQLRVADDQSSRSCIGKGDGFNVGGRIQSVEIGGDCENAVRDVDYFDIRVFGQRKTIGIGLNIGDFISGCSRKLCFDFRIRQILRRRKSDIASIFEQDRCDCVQIVPEIHFVVQEIEIGFDIRSRLGNLE